MASQGNNGKTHLGPQRSLSVSHDHSLHLFVPTLMVHLQPGVNPVEQTLDLLIFDIRTGGA